MLSQKGFAPILVILLIMVSLGIAGAYYLKTSNSQPLTQTNANHPIPAPIESIAQDMTKKKLAAIKERQQHPIANQMPTTNTPTTDCPNPKLEKVAFSSKGDIYIIAVDGTCLKQLTQYGANFKPKLSLDGSIVAYYSIAQEVKSSVFKQTGQFDGKGVNIWTINIDGSNPHKLTDTNLTVSRTNLAWSPNGKQLLFDESGKIMTVNGDGSGKKLVIDLKTVPDIPDTADVNYFRKVIWSPDSNKIAIFTYTKKDPPIPGEGTPNYSTVFVYDLNGSLKASYPAAKLQSVQFPYYWSPDNSFYYILGGNGIGNYALWKTKIDGSNPTFLAGNKDTNQSIKESTDLLQSAIYGGNPAAFSADGKQIATVKQSIGGIWTINSDGTNSQNIFPLQEVRAGSLAWTPDNNYLILSVSDKNSISLYSLNLLTKTFSLLDAGSFTPTPPYILYDDEFSTGSD